MRCLQFREVPAHYDEVYLEMARRGARVLALGHKKLGALTHQQVTGDNCSGAGQDLVEEGRPLGVKGGGATSTWETCRNVKTIKFALVARTKSEAHTHFSGACGEGPWVCECCDFRTASTNVVFLLSGQRLRTRESRV